MSKQQRAFVTAMLSDIPQPEQIAQQHTAAQQRQAAEKERRWRDRLTPLDDRLRKVLDDIPDSIKAEGIRLPPLVHQLIGRTRQHPSAGDVGKALRRLGWRRKRDWSNGDEGYPAVWYPPPQQSSMRTTTMNYPNLAAAVATRYPNANERTRDRLCRSALHETAHLFVARIVDANPYKLRIQRSGAGWIHVHSHDEREILISLAGVAMEYRIEGDYSRELPATFGDFDDAHKWSTKKWNVERPGIIAGKILRDLVTMYGWPDVWRLIEETAVRAITKARKADGILSADKTDALCKWLDSELKRSGLGEELSPLRNRVRLN